MSNWQAKARKSAPAAPLTPLIPLYPYEQRFISDPARLKGWVKSRQIGGSFTGTLAMVLDALARHDDWNTMSRTGRQARKLLAKAAKHVNAIDFYVRNRFNQPSILEKPPSSEEIVLKCGAVLAALPCDPDTTVGDTVNWLLDEAALYPNSDTIFGTIKPSIMHGKRMLMVSTPRGRRGKFADLYESWKRDPASSGWSWHVTTIEDAMREGLVLRDHLGRVLDFETFKRQEIRDIGLEMWLQEYMCVFSDLLSAFLGWTLVQTSRHLDGVVVTPPEQLVQYARQGCELYAGVDIGRRKDLTVIWIVARRPDGHYESVCTLKLDRVAFATQEELLASYLKTGLILRCCIDQTGIGMQLAENMQMEFGGLVEPVTFTNATKAAMAEKLRVQMESGNFTFHDGEEEEISEDFASIEKIVTAQNNVRLEAAPGNQTHGDYFWAACLAVKAATDYGPGEIAMAAT